MTGKLIARNISFRGGRAIPRQGNGEKACRTVGSLFYVGSQGHDTYYILDKPLSSSYMINNPVPVKKAYVGNSQQNIGTNIWIECSGYS
jgi:hypothetical protein